MTTRLTGSVTNVTGIFGITISDAHNSISACATIECKDTTLDIGDEAVVNIGYNGVNTKVFSGYVKRVEYVVPECTYVIIINDEMIKAVDYFIASSTPDNPFKRQNIAAEDLVEDLFELADITNYTSETTYFTFGITVPVEVNLVSVHDFCQMVADILAYEVWADSDNVAHFENRRPYVMNDDTPTTVVVATDILNISYRRSDRDLRNRIVVYGSTGIYAEASEESPYLPDGFYKTAVLASPYINSTELAQRGADFNLDKLNRLTEECSIEVIGNPIYKARTVITVTESFTGVTGDWYIYSCEHKWGDAGYTTSMELRR